ncbi:MAG: polysaccharide deacetylase family protein [Kofleriaceae bacterium]
MLCAASIDRAVGEPEASIVAALDRARDRDEVVQLYGHRPGRLSDLDRVEAIAAGAQARGLATLTYAELAAGVPAVAGLALSFDDADVDLWTAAAARVAPYGTRLTFFVTRYHLWTEAQRAALAALAAQGHDVEAHGVNHLRGPEVAEAHGVAAYLADEVLPSLDRLRADGYAPTVFAYPYGARTPELDRAVLAHVALVRSVSFTTDNLVVADPCPE